MQILKFASSVRPGFVAEPDRVLYTIIYRYGTAAGSVAKVRPTFRHRAFSDRSSSQC